MTTKSRATQVLLLQAASQIILTSGIQALTLDAVAAAAGVSKGGLLYHFPSKDALTAGLVEHYLERFEARLAKFAAASTASPAHAWARAYVQASLAPGEDGDDVSAGLIAAVAQNPALLDPLRERYQVWQQRLEAAVDPETAHLIRFSLDGWWAANLLRLGAVDEAARTALEHALLALIQGAT